MSFRVGLVVCVRAAQERYAVEHALLKPFQRQINHGRDIQRDELGNDQPADNDQPEWPARGAVGAKAERNRSAPINAARVVMMIGRNRSTLAS